MKISQKGLYALQAMVVLARHYKEGAIRIRDIAYEEGLPKKFLELILLELKNARIVESVRGAKGGYQLRRSPSEIHLGEALRLLEGPFGDTKQFRKLLDRDASHGALYQTFLNARDAAVQILEQTTLADVAAGKVSTLVLPPQAQQNVHERCCSAHGRSEQREQRREMSNVIPRLLLSLFPLAQCCRRR